MNMLAADPVNMGISIDRSQISPSVHSNISYRPDIDGLRAVAVLSVVAFHAFPNFIRGGFIGVDVFFIISGYLISGIIFSKLYQETFSFSEFYSRRIKRIFPALILVLAACLTFGWYVLMTDEYRQLGDEVAAGAGFVANILFWNEAGYFDNAASTKPLLHLWSLGIEEQFYIFWPLLLLAAYKRRANLLTLTGIILAVSFALNIALVDQYPVATYYLPFMRFWELSMGSILAYLSLQNTNPSLSKKGAVSSPTILAHCQSFLGIALIGYAITHINKSDPFPGWWAMLPTLGAYFSISAGKDTWFNRYFLSNKIVVWFGLISYPLYLWHWPLLSFLSIIAGPRPPHALRLVAVLVSIILAWLTYQYIEKNIRFNKGKAVIPALCIVSFMILLGGIVISQQVVKSRLNDPELDKLLLAQNDWDYPTKHFVRYQYGAKDYYIQPAGPGKTLFIGDSNVEQYAPNISKLLVENPTYNSAIFATTGSCPPIPNVFVKEQPDCQPRLASAIKLAFSKEIDTVVIGGCWYCYFVDALKHDSAYDYYFKKDGQKEYFKNGRAPQLAMKSFSEMMQKLSAQKKVFLILNAPAGPTMDPMCLAKGSRLSPRLQFDTPPGVQFVEFEKSFGSTRTALKNIALASGATVIDPLAFLCKDGLCPAVTTDGLPIYKDALHIRATYVENSIDYLDETIKPSSACKEKGCLVRVVQYTP